MDSLNGRRVRVVRDASGDLPKSLIGRYGVILKQRGEDDGYQLFSVKMDGWKKPFDLYEDEFETIK
jgi:hypothetical protein